MFRAVRGVALKGKPAAAATVWPELPGDRDTPEVLLVLGQNRWRAGASTKGYVSAYFYAELPAAFTGTLPFAFDTTSNLALYSPIGVPNTDSPNSNAPANTEPRIHASMYWDDGIPLPPQAFVGGALLEIELYGALKVGRPGTLYVVIDPDGDVRLDARGDNLTLASERMKVLGAESGVRTHVPGFAQNSGGIVEILLPAHGLSDGELVWLSAGDRTLGIQPELIDGGWYHAIVLDADRFRPSTSGPDAPTFVPWSADDEAPEVVVTRSTSSGFVEAGQVRLRAGVEHARERFPALPPARARARRRTRPERHGRWRVVVRGARDVRGLRSHRHEFNDRRRDRRRPDRAALGCGGDTHFTRAWTVEHADDSNRGSVAARVERLRRARQQGLLLERA